MLSVNAAREAVQKKYEANFARWAVGLAAPDAIALPREAPDAVHQGPQAISAFMELPLHPPTERKTLADLGAVFAWSDDLRDAGVPYLLRVHRNWGTVSGQHLPERLRFTGPAEVAAFAGKAGHWTRVSSRVTGLLILSGGRHEMGQDTSGPAHRALLRCLRTPGAGSDGASTTRRDAHPRSFPAAVLPDGPLFPRG